MSFIKTDPDDIALRRKQKAPSQPAVLPSARRSVEEAPGRGGASRSLADVTSVVFLLVPQFSMIAFSSAIEPLRLANRVHGQETFSWQVLSVDGGRS